jgi:hypothetical protein
MIGKAIRDKIKREIVFGKCSYMFSVQEKDCDERKYCVFTEETECGEQGVFRKEKTVGIEYRVCKLQ